MNPSNPPQEKPKINHLPSEMVNKILFHLKDNFDDQVNLIEGIFTKQAIKVEWHISLLQQFYPEAYKVWECIKDELPALRKKHGGRLLPLSALARCVWQRKIIGINTGSPVVKTVYIPIEICQLNSLPPEYPTHEGLLQAAVRVGNTALCLWLLEDQGLTNSIEAVCRTAVEFGSTDTVLALLEWTKKNNDELKYKDIASEILDLAIYNCNEKLIEILMHDRDIMPTLHKLAALFIQAKEHRLTLRFDEKIFFQTIFTKLTEDERKELVKNITTISEVYKNVKVKGEIAFLEELKMFEGFKKIIDTYIQEEGIAREKIVQSQKSLLYRAIQSGNFKRVVDLHEKQAVPLSIGELVDRVSREYRPPFSYPKPTPNVTMNYFLKQKANTITEEECEQLLKIRYDNALEVSLDCLRAKSEEAITDWVEFIQNAVSHEEDSMDIIHAYRIKRFSQQFSREELYEKTMKIAIKEDNCEVVRGLLEEKNIPPLWNEYAVMEHAIKEGGFKIVMGLLEISGDKFKEEAFLWEEVLCKSIPEDPYKFNKLSMIVCELLNRKVFLPTEELLVQYATQIVRKEIPSINGIQLILILLDKFKMPYSGTIDQYIKFTKNFQLLEKLALHKQYPQIIFEQNPQEELAWIEGILKEIFSKQNGYHADYEENKLACLESLCNLIVHYNIQQKLILTGALSDIAEAGRLDLVMKLIDYKKQNKLLFDEDKIVVNQHFTLGKSGEAWLAEVFSDVKSREKQVTSNDLEGTSRRKKGLGI